MSGAYHETRLADDKRRDVLWQTLWDAYFKLRISPQACVLDIGAGYGQFINNVEARRRIALDLWPGMVEHLDKDVEPLVGDLAELENLKISQSITLSPVIFLNMSRRKNFRMC